MRHVFVGKIFQNFIKILEMLRLQSYRPVF